MTRAASVIVAALAGCSFQGGYDGTHYRCGAGGACPSGQTCVANACVTSFDPPDAAPGTPDAPIGVGRCGSLALLRDAFDSALPLWDPWTDGGPTTAIAGGALVISIPAGGAVLWAGYGSHYQYDFTGSVFEATVAQVGGTNTVVEVRAASGARAQVLVENGELFAGVYDVPGEGARAHVTYDPAVHKRWRLREAAGVMYWEWSTDGAAWTELWHEDDPFPVEHVTGQLAAGGELASPSSARFADVNLGVTAPAGLCASHTLVDDFGGGGFGPWLVAWADAGATIVETGGQAVVATSGASNVWSGFQSTHLYDLRDDAYYVDMTTLPQASPFVSWAQALVPGDGRTRMEINVESNTLLALQQIDGVNVTSKSVVYDPIAHRYWRFRSAGDQLFWETSPDASAWTVLLQAAAQLDPSAVHIVVGAGEYASTTARTARVGGVNAP